MKAKYLDELKNKLIEFQASKEDINDIIKDYSQIYDDMLDTGRNDEEIYKLLGEPNHVAYELIDTLRIKRKKDIRNKLIALMPFISVVLSAVTAFLLLGILLDGWIYAWQVFLAIPVFAILLFDKKFRLTPLMPFIAVVIFFNLGMFAGLWTISWMAFLLIPITAIIENA